MDSILAFVLIETTGLNIFFAPFTQWSLVAGPVLNTTNVQLIFAGMDYSELCSSDHPAKEFCQDYAISCAESTGCWTMASIIHIVAIVVWLFDRFAPPVVQHKLSKCCCTPKRPRSCTCMNVNMFIASVLALISMVLWQTVCIPRLQSANNLQEAELLPPYYQYLCLAILELLIALVHGQQRWKRHRSVEEVPATMMEATSE